ncbi:hypothetical protein L6164_022888 [Bauhinia variegata]|uniref:Uncharacterized protein n=1 Tax=Bauhinia variegata TaxID=167791 RepID=A0ACB9MHV9_BAUVA|nr:hypothetical protein L6164_022888 [Bauhinia variegata]
MKQFFHTGMALSRPFTPQNSISTTSASLTSQNKVNKKVNNTALSFEETKRKIKKMFNKVDLCVSSYDTAWVATIPSPTSPHVPFFPQCLNWLLDNQLKDGSWGLPDHNPLLMKDTLLSTLACVLALKQWGTGEEQISRGLQFIESNFSSVSDEKLCSPIGFDIIFPALIECSVNLGINLPVDSTKLEAMIHQRELELQRGCQNNSEGWRAYLAYVSEGIGKSEDWQMVIKYQRKNGSLFNSPATTAAAFKHLKNADCLNYIKMVLEKFGAAVPTVYPLDIYAHLCMIDNLQKLGIDRHFSIEIQKALEEIYGYWLNREEDIFLDPTTCAKAFRILRLNGYDVSSDPFDQYSEDKFSNSLKGFLNDADAVLELYQASQIVIHPDEPILVRQNYWSRNFLEKAPSCDTVHVDKLRSYIDHEVKDALKFPSHANLERLLNRRTMQNFDVDNTRILKTSFRSTNLANQEFLNLAVDDFNICQSIQQEELRQLARWVVDSRLDKLKFARQKLAYCYFSSAATLFSPELSDARISWAKNGVLTTVVDDFFDIAGSEEELANLIQLVEKWDVDVSSDSCSLPVEIIFSALRGTICEIAEKAFKFQGRCVKVDVIKIWLDLMHSMMTETRWSMAKSVPTIDDYMANGYTSFALGPIVLPALFLVGPKLPSGIIQSPELNTLFKLMSTGGRLLNDIHSFKRESGEGKLNAITLRVLHRNGAVTAEGAIEELKGIVEDKRRELLRLVLQDKGSIVPRACKDLFWKMAKVLFLFYLKDDGFTSHEMFSIVNSVIEEPVVLNESVAGKQDNLLLSC